MYDPAHPFGKKRYDRAIIDPVSCTGCGYCTMFCVMDCILLQPDGFYTRWIWTAASDAGPVR